MATARAVLSTFLCFSLVLVHLPIYAMELGYVSNNNNSPSYTPPITPKDMHQKPGPIYLSDNNNDKILPSSIPQNQPDFLPMQLLPYFVEEHKKSALQVGLDRLSEKVLNATGADDHLHQHLQDQLKAYHSYSSNPQVLPLLKEAEHLLSPEELLQFEKSSLCVGETLKPSDDRFSAIHLALERLNTIEKTITPPLVLKRSMDLLRKRYTSFLDQFCKASLAQRKDMFLQKQDPFEEQDTLFKSELLGSYSISASMARTLINKNICELRNLSDQEGGMSAVVGKDGVHFKDGQSAINGINPAMEWAAHAFSVLLLGPGYTPPSAAIVLGKIRFLNLTPEGEKNPKGKEIQQLFQQEAIFPKTPSTLRAFFAKYPAYYSFFQTYHKPAYLQASETSGDISLYQFLDHIKQGKASLKDIDATSYSGMTLLSLLLNFTDAKDDNIRLTKEGKLISIDNDRVFGQMITKLKDNEHLIEAKNVLFLMQECMQLPVAPKIKQLFTSLDPDLFLLQWLWACHRQNEGYQRLYQNAQLPTGCEPSQITFQKGLILDLRNRLQTIKTALTSDLKITHQDLLARLNKVAADFYAAFWTGLSTQDSLHEIQGRLWKGPAIESILPSLPKESYAAFTAAPGVYETNRNSSPKEEAIGVLNTFDPAEKKSPEIRLKLFSYISGWLPWPKAWNNSVSLLTLASDALASTHLLRKEMLERLVSNPLFDPRQADADGNTLLHLWAQSSLGMSGDQEFLTKILKIYQDKGGYLEALNNKGMSVFDCALQQQHEGLLQVLLTQGFGRKYYDHNLETFYHHARTNSKWKDSALQHLFKTRKVTDPHFAWTLQRSRMLSPIGSGEEIQILTYNQGRIQQEKRFLSSEVKAQLWDEKSNFKAIHTNGAREVGRVIPKEDQKKQSAPQSRTSCLYFKRYPSLPGVAIAVSLLHEKLFGDGFVPLTFAKIKGEPFLLSPGVGSLEWDPKEKFWKQNTNLQVILKYVPELLKKLDKEALPRNILMAILVNPEDGKPSNYILEKNSKDLYSMYGIDEEQAFVPAVVKAPEGAEMLTTFIVQMKSVLFCFDEMELSLSACLQQTVQKWHPWEILKNWVQILTLFQKEIRGLFSNPGEKEKLFKDKESYLEIPFQSGDGGKLLKKLHILQSALAEHPDTKLKELFSKLEPFAAHRYAPVFESLKDKAVLERFNKIDLPIYEYNQPTLFKVSQYFIKRDDLPSSIRSMHLLKSRNIPLYQDRKETLKKGLTFDPSLALKELEDTLVRVKGEALIKIQKKGTKQKDQKQAEVIAKLLKHAQIEEVSGLDLRSYSSYEQKLILSTLERLHFKSLSLYAISEVGEEFLKKLALENMEVLELRNCGLADKDVSVISTQAEKLRELDLSENPGIKKLGNQEKGVAAYLVFPSLEKLILNKCDNLESIVIQGSKMDWVKANKCKKLSFLALSTPKLQFLSLRDNPLITNNSIFNPGHDHPHIQKIDAQGSPQVSEWIQEEVINKNLVLTNIKLGSHLAQQGPQIRKEYPKFLEKWKGKLPGRNLPTDDEVYTPKWHDDDPSNYYGLDWRWKRGEVFEDSICALQEMGLQDLMQQEINEHSRNSQDAFKVMRALSTAGLTELAEQAGKECINHLNYARNALHATKGFLNLGLEDWAKQAARKSLDLIKTIFDGEDAMEALEKVGLNKLIRQAAEKGVKKLKNADGSYSKYTMKSIVEKMQKLGFYDLAEDVQRYGVEKGFDGW